MNWLLALLAGLVLVQAGAGVCPAAHAQGGDEAASMVHASHGAAPAAHGGDHACDTGSETAPVHDTEDCCGGGAACADCSLLTVALADAPIAATPPLAGPARDLRPTDAPPLSFPFDPPPPRRAHA